MRTFSDSEYSDEMQHYEAFYQCLHWLIFGEKIHHGNYNLLPLDTYIETTRKKKIQRANGAMNTHMHARMTPASGWADGLG